MKNYFDKQKKSTLTQIEKLYKDKDASFRGFRHNAGAGPSGEKANSKRDIAIQGSEVMDGLVNWEGSQTSDGDRFSSIYTNQNGNKSLKSFEFVI